MNSKEAERGTERAKEKRIKDIVERLLQMASCNISAALMKSSRRLLLLLFSVSRQSLPERCTCEL